MFTIEEIENLHLASEKGMDFIEFLNKLKEMNVEYYDFYVSDGRYKYTHIDGDSIETKPLYEKKEISTVSNVGMLKQSVKVHQNGDTDFLTFCRQASESGVMIWRVEITNLRVTYLGHDFGELLVENMIK